jgi:hypothetical protein
MALFSFGQVEKMGNGRVIARVAQRWRVITLKTA